MSDCSTNGFKVKQIPESWLDRCSDNGYERFTDEDGKRRYKDNCQLVSDAPFRPCARCGHYPNEDGDDHCIKNLGRVINACCGHGTHDGYIMFDDGRTIRGSFTVEPSPDGWEYVDTLEQRYEQLGQVAKVMLWNHATMAVEARKEEAWETVKLVERCMRELHEQLEELGVSVND